VATISGQTLMDCSFFLKVANSVEIQRKWGVDS